MFLLLVSHQLREQGGGKIYLQSAHELCTLLKTHCGSQASKVHISLSLLDESVKVRREKSVSEREELCTGRN